MKEKNISHQNGFTLLELLVVIALMGIIYTITLSDYNGMNKSIELQNTAYNTALSIRESQVYGINKKLDSGEFSDSDPYAFGMHLDKSNDNKNRIIIFKDKNKNKKFDGGCSSDIQECERYIEFNGGNHISRIKVKEDSGGSFQSTSEIMNVLFTRPNPDAEIISNSGDVYSRIRIKLSSKDEIYNSCVEIGSAGDISLKPDC